MLSDRQPFYPTCEQKIDILRRLLKLARVGRIGPVYAYDSCTRETVVEIGSWAVEFKPMHVCMERRRISWREALTLADTWTTLKKPLDVAKRSARLPGSMRKRAWNQDLELARCDLEIAEVYNRPADQGHWLQLMGIADWETEKVLILKESACGRILE